MQTEFEPAPPKEEPVDPDEIESLREEEAEAPSTADLVEAAGVAAGMAENIPYQELEAFARKKAEYLAALCETLRSRAIMATQPQDWVKMGEKFYLMDHGCQRAGAPWGIEFDKLEPSTDIVPLDDLADNHKGYLVAAKGSCRVLNVTRADVGTKSTSNRFFIKQWTDEETSDTRRDQIKLDVMKGAIANAYGRIIRAITGLNSVTKEVLEAHGIDTSKCPEADFAKGSHGGGMPGPASEKQLNYAYTLGIKKNHVTDQPEPDEISPHFRAALEQGTALKKKVSSFIDACQNQKDYKISWADFVSEVLGSPEVKKT